VVLAVPHCEGIDKLMSCGRHLAGSRWVVAGTRTISIQRSHGLVGWPARQPRPVVTSARSMASGNRTVGEAATAGGLDVDAGGNGVPLACARSVPPGIKSFRGWLQATQLVTGSPQC